MSSVLLLVSPVSLARRSSSISCSGRSARSAAALRSRCSPSSTTSPRRSTAPSVNASSVVGAVDGHGDRLGRRDGGHADRRSRRDVDLHGRALAQQQRAEVTGRDQPQRPCVQVELAEQQGGELVVDVDVEQRAQLAQHRLDVGALGEIGAHREAQGRHRRRRGQAAAGDVADDERDAAGTARDHVVPVAPHVELVDAGDVPGGDVDAVERGHRGQQRVLQGAGDPALFAVEALVLLGEPLRDQAPAADRLEDRGPADRQRAAHAEHDPRQRGRQRAGQVRRRGPDDGDAGVPERHARRAGSPPIGVGAVDSSNRSGGGVLAQVQGDVQPLQRRVLRGREPVALGQRGLRVDDEAAPAAGASA